MAHRVRRRLRRWLTIGLLTVLAASVAGLLALCAVLAVFPYPEDRIHARFPDSRRILDRQGRLLREAVGSGGERARWTELDQISPLVITATVSVEDEHFWEHRGIDVPAVIRAGLQNLLSGKVVSGASTITMQLARLKGGHPRSLSGKVLQAFDALRLERSLTKEDILEQYLNRASFAVGTVGIEAASHRIFGKPSRHLSLAEASMLSGLTQAPSLLNPFRSPDAAHRRQQHVLARMSAAGVIAADDVEWALAEPLRFVDQPTKLSVMHFTDWLLTRGIPPGEVRTTIDLDLQLQIERLVTEHVRSMSIGGLTNAAVIVIDNSDLGVLAMIGSADYWEGDDGAVNGALARRQPGSTLKPFTYALAFSKGMSPASVAADIEVEYLGADGSHFSPRNYDGLFNGPLLLGEALGRSLNVPAIRLANVVGAEALLRSLRGAGFDSLDREAGHYGLGLTLGNGEVTLLELAQAYTMFANGGDAHRVRVLLDEPLSQPVEVFSDEVCYLITGILSDEALRVRAFGSATPLLLPFSMAVKTGTSNNWRDSWAVGYTQRYTVAVWSGDFGGESMDRLTGALGAGPLFHRVARLVVERGAVHFQPELVEAPEGVEQRVVCALSGKVPTQACPRVQTVTVLRNEESLSDCEWHRMLRIDRRNGFLASEKCPSQHAVLEMFETLPPSYAEWQARHLTHQPPTRWSPLCPADGVSANALVITSPRPREVYLLEPGYDPDSQSLQLRGEVHPSLPEITWLIDGRQLASAEWPYDAVWRLEPGSHRVQMVAGDRHSQTVEFEVR